MGFFEGTQAFLAGPHYCYLCAFKSPDHFCSKFSGRAFHLYSFLVMSVEIYVK